MTRQWKDADGRVWRLSAPRPVPEGAPYSIQFAHGHERHWKTYAGGRALDELTSDELEELFRQTTG